MGAEQFDSDEMGTITAINVTPFVDVVLVLLVIFMITAPAIMKDVIGIQLPKSVAAEKSMSATLGVAVNKDGQILLNGALTSVDNVVTEVQTALKKDPNTQIIISADESSRHGDVVRAVDLVKSAGAIRFAFQIQKP